jgi:DNA polymerase III subunit gamma/tau
MSYQVIARKWRPQTFADVVGQQHVTRTLSNAIQSGRVAHAYIFSGARGVGKTTTARILAKALNCAKGPAAEPCNECDSCREIGLGNSLDVIEIDAASNRGIDQIRELREMVRYAPAGGRFKVVILDEAHALTDEASNALLKTLEEPPDKVIFVMATTQPEDLADTIRSRSQHFHFRALSFAEISDALVDICAKESLTAEPGAIAVMSRAAEGSLRDGLSLLEQARAYCGSNITDAQVRELLGVVPGEILDELTGAIEERSAERVLSLVHRLLAEGQNLQHFCREAIGHFRNLLVARVCGADSDLVAAPKDERPRLAEQASNFSEEDLTRFFNILLATDDDLRRHPDPRLHLELGLLKLVNAQRLAPLEEVLAELRGEPRGETRSGSQDSSRTTKPTPISSGNAPRAFAPTQSISSSSPSGAATAARMAPDPTPSPFKAAAPETISGPTELPAAAPRVPIATAPAAPIPAAPLRIVARTAEDSGGGLGSAQVDAIKAALQGQKFLWSMVEAVTRWEVENNELHLFFPSESRVLAEMLQAREPMERLRTVLNQVVGKPLRVCVKLETGRAATNRSSELRARFELDPIVRALLEKFGGQISKVKRPGEE